MRQQIRIQSMHGSIGPVRRPTQGEEGGGQGEAGAEAGKRPGNPRRLQAKGERGDPPRKRGEEKGKGEEKEKRREQSL